MRTLAAFMAGAALVFVALFAGYEVGSHRAAAQSLDSAKTHADVTASASPAASTSPTPVVGKSSATPVVRQRRKAAASPAVANNVSTDGVPIPTESLPLYIGEVGVQSGLDSVQLNEISECLAAGDCTELAQQLFATFEGVGTSSNPANSTDICLEGGTCTAAQQQAIHGQY